MGMRPVVIVLAAGLGQRFLGAGHKLRQELAGGPLLAQTLTHAIASGLRVVVVTSEELKPIACGQVAARDIVTLPERDSKGRPHPIGMGHSLAAGVAATGDADGWLVLPGDMPMLQPRTIQAVAQALNQHPIAFGQHRGQRGHPVGFAAELYSELVGLQGDEGARRLLARFPSHGVEVDDPGVLIDVDTEADLARVRALRALRA